MQKINLELTPSDARLIVRGLKRLKSHLKYTDKGTVSNEADRKDIDIILSKLEGFADKA